MCSDVFIKSVADANHGTQVIDSTRMLIFELGYCRKFLSKGSFDENMIDGWY
jgi:hypothetical protein